jgi:hypothetical protein
MKKTITLNESELISLIERIIKESNGIVIDDGTKKKTIQLNQYNKGLYICPFIWRELDNFSDSAVCLVLASDFYKEDDYFRDYNVFVDFILKLK